jgi:septum formation protein
LEIQSISQQLVLGSSSIYRQELLKRLQIPFETAVPNIDESPFSGELPQATAMRLAEAKAHAIAVAYPDALIIGADQVAVLDSVQLGKPLNHVNAVKQLRFMRGKEVIFHTALCLFNSHSNHIQTREIPYYIKFRKLTDQQIENYLNKEQPYHCAGSAKSEGLGVALIERMTGDDPNALVGLPLIALVDMLINEGVEIV